MLAIQTNNGSKCINTKNALSKASTDSRNSNTKDYSKLAIGSLALMQCHLSKKWEKVVRIVKLRENGTSYIVEGVASGKQYVRGRRLLKPHPNPYFYEEESSTQNSVNRETPRRKEADRIQPPRAAKRKMSNAHHANRVHHVWTTTPSRPCHGGKRHQFQPLVSMWWKSIAMAARLSSTGS